MTEKVNIDVIVDQGKSRSENQDDHLVMKFEEDGKPSIYVCAIADGVGSFENSGLASSYTIANLRKWFEQTGHDKLLAMRFEAITERLYNAVKKIHESLVAIAEEKEISYGTTLTLLCIIDNSYIVIQVGDSRCYLYENHIIRQITRDQTLAERKRLSGEVVTDRKDESTLIQCLGKGEMEPAIFDGILSDEYMFLINSDGLSNTLGHKQIADTIKVNWTGKKKLEALVTNARSNGEKDNISGILLQHTKI